MQNQDGANNPTGGTDQGQANEGNSNDIKALIKSVDTLKGVLGDVVTKVSEIDRRTSESQELERIMRSMNSEDDRLPTNNPRGTAAPPPTKKQPADVENMSKAELVSLIRGEMGREISAVKTMVGDLDSKLGVKTLSMSDPNWDKDVRPVAFKLSKQPGFDQLNVEQLDQVSRGLNALKKVETLTEELTKKDERIKELEESMPAGGDKPGLFVGVPEPPKEMNEDESFDDALVKAGLDKLPR